MHTQIATRAGSEAARRWLTGDQYGAPIAAFPTQRLFGLDFVCDASIGTVADALLAGTNGDRWRCVVTPNVDHVVRYDRHADEYDVATRASLVLPDGMPIVWASRLLGRRLGGRLAGSDLFVTLWPRLAAGAVPTVVVAASADVAARLAAEHPVLRCVVPPQFELGDDAAIGGVVDEIVDATGALGAEFCVLGLSMPKMHRLTAELYRRWSAGDARTPTVLLLGASAEFYLGLARRAPKWMQRIGLEWLFRLAREPRRLARRYLVDDPRFALLVWREWRRQHRPC